jgi:hypothetical protein
MFADSKSLCNPDETCKSQPQFVALPPVANLSGRWIRLATQLAVAPIIEYAENSLRGQGQQNSLVLVKLDQALDYIVK